MEVEQGAGRGPSQGVDSEVRKMMIAAINKIYNPMGKSFDIFDIQVALHFKELLFVERLPHVLQVFLRLQSPLSVHPPHVALLCFERPLLGVHQVGVVVYFFRFFFGSPIQDNGNNCDDYEHAHRDPNGEVQF